MFLHCDSPKVSTHQKHFSAEATWVFAGRVNHFVSGYNLFHEGAVFAEVLLPVASHVICCFELWPTHWKARKTHRWLGLDPILDASTQMQANGTWCCEWECPHWTQATSNELSANLRARVQCGFGLGDLWYSQWQWLEWEQTHSVRCPGFLQAWPYCTFLQLQSPQKKQNIFSVETILIPPSHHDSLFVVLTVTHVLALVAMVRVFVSLKQWLGLEGPVTAVARLATHVRVTERLVTAQLRQNVEFPVTLVAFQLATRWNNAKRFGVHWQNEPRWSFWLQVLFLPSFWESCFTSNVLGFLSGKKEWSPVECFFRLWIAKPSFDLKRRSQESQL